MKTRKKVLLIILAVLVAAGGAIILWQRENLKALQTAKQYSYEEIEQQLSENDSAVQEAVDAYPEIHVRPITEEEKQQLRSGELSEEELVERLTQPVEESAEEKEQSPKTEEKSDETQNQTPDEKSETDTRLSALIAELFVLRETYTQTLDAMMLEAAEEYAGSSFSASELAKFVSRYVSRATVLERECDRKIDDLANRIQDVVEETDGDPSIVDTVISTYAEEKYLKKAWYVSKLQQRGLMG